MDGRIPVIPVPAFDFDSHRKIATEEYRRLRPLYVKFAIIVRKISETALSDQAVKVAAVEERAKTIESFGRKCCDRSKSDPGRPKYQKPLSDIRDLAGVRIITFFPKTVFDVDALIYKEFTVIEKEDKAGLLEAEGTFGYGSIHYLVRLDEERAGSAKYTRFAGLIAEIQVRTILQHAWAEISHDIQYRVETIPLSIKRGFMRLAILLETADQAIQAIQDEHERLLKGAGI